MKKKRVEGPSQACGLVDPMRPGATGIYGYGLERWCPSSPLSLLLYLLLPLFFILSAAITCGSTVCVQWITIISSVTSFLEIPVLQSNLIQTTNLNILGSSSTFPPHKASRTSPRLPHQPTSNLFSLIYQILASPASIPTFLFRAPLTLQPPCHLLRLQPLQVPPLLLLPSQPSPLLPT